MTMITYDDILLSVLQEVRDLIIQSRHGSFLHSLCAVKITEQLTPSLTFCKYILFFLNILLA